MMLPCKTMSVHPALRSILLGTIFWVSLGACGADQAPEQAVPTTEPREGEASATEDGPRVFTIGFVPIDIDTEVEQQLDLPGGMNTQCRELNALVSEVCCEDFAMGCNLTFDCRVLPLQADQRLEKTAYQYQREEGNPNYAMHHGTVQRGVARFLREMQLLQASRELLPVAVTRHPIIIDDQETKDPDNKIRPGDLRSHWLGLIRSSPTDRGGIKIVLDYYSSQEGLFMSLTPLNEAALSQAVVEQRSGIVTFAEKQFTGTGARHLFSMNGEGRIVPKRLGCANLTKD